MERDDGSKEPPAFISAIEWPRIPAEYLKMWVVDQQTSTKKELVGYECSCGAVKGKKIVIHMEHFLKEVDRVMN